MADEIIDLTRYLKRGEDKELPRGAMALWGADGERSRFALPLWRLVYLVKGDRCLIVSRGPGEDAIPFVALDLAEEPARVTIPADLPQADEGLVSPTLLDLGSEGIVVYLGDRIDRSWFLLADGGEGRSEPLSAAVREDLLFLAGECAGLLFLRDLADEVEGEEP